MESIAPLGSKAGKVAIGAIENLQAAIADCAATQLLELRPSPMDTASNTLVLALIGEIDIATTPYLRRFLQTLMTGFGLSRLILDMSDCVYVDSQGLECLLHTTRQMQAAGGEVILATLMPRVRRLLNITGLDQYLVVTEAVDHTKATSAMNGSNTE